MDRGNFRTFRRRHHCKTKTIKDEYQSENCKSSPYLKVQATVGGSIECVLWYFNVHSNEQFYGRCK